MSTVLETPASSILARLKQLRQKRAAVERCELCSRELLAEHEHLVEPANHKLVCACDACAILFDGQRGKYKRVPRTVRFLETFQLSEGQWDNLAIPIELAFFFRSSPQEKIIAMYPSPAGAMESLLSLDTWDDLVRANPILGVMNADVEALLVNRAGASRGSARAEYFVVPIDACYKLVGLIRTHWRGFSGGTDVWQEIEAFFADLKKRSGAHREAAHA
jgi:Family of unknown function (DUF5947)